MTNADENHFPKLISDQFRERDNKIKDLEHQVTRLNYQVGTLLLDYHRIKSNVDDLISDLDELTNPDDQEDQEDECISGDFYLDLTEKILAVIEDELKKLGK